MKNNFYILLLVSIVIPSSAMDVLSDVTFYINDKPISVQPIYDDTGVALVPGPYSTAPSVSFNSDMLNISIVRTAAYTGTEPVKCDFQIETHSGYKSYRHSEHVKNLPGAQISKTDKPEFKHFKCEFKDIGNILKSAKANIHSGEYVMHFWVIPTGKNIVNIPFLVKDDAAWIHRQ